MIQIMVSRPVTRSMVSESVDVIVEIPYGEEIKYEWDPVSGRMRADRRLTNTAPMLYPGNYGYIPDTLSGDGDPVDALILTEYPYKQGSIVECHVLGALITTDEKGRDEKILVIPKLDTRPWRNLGDIESNLKGKIHHFFTHYKDNDDGKWVDVEDFVNSKEAIDIISKSRQ